MTVLEQIKNGTHKISQTRLKKLIGDKPNNYFTNFKGTKATEFGNIVEGIVLEGQQKYQILDFKPTPSVEELTDWLIFNNLPPADHNILSWCEFTSFGSVNWKASTKIKKLVEGKVREYYELKKDSTIPLILQEDEDEAYRLAQSLSKLPVFEDFQEGKVQKLVEFEFEGEQCKGTYDLFFKDTFQIVDLKIVSEDPIRSARKYRWDIQGAFYYEPLPEGSPLPIFIVGKRYDPDNPVIIHMTQNDLISGKEGLDILRNTSTGPGSYRVQGFKELISRFKWHRDNDKWDYSKEYYELGYKPLNLFT